MVSMVNGDAFYYCSDVNKNVNIFRCVKSEFHKSLIYVYYSLVKSST